MQNNEVNERKTFNAKVKDTLTAVKPEKGCCKKAYAYGEQLFKRDDFSFIDRSFIKCQSCAPNFLRGVFVSLGSVSAPEKGHHLEIKLDSSQRRTNLLFFLPKPVSKQKYRSDVRPTSCILRTEILFSNFLALLAHKRAHLTFWRS